ncbi:MAG: acyltransferase [Tannerella sp.]|jgi:fucose 4-O-acetylase-like acetyltransferase|nr:acyltransferase [Tannerella sp.]
MQQTKELQSNVIDVLRFPLIIGVMFIHNFTSTATMPGIEFGKSENLPIFNVCSTLFSQILGQVAVPLFFFISGFLFFVNLEGFTKHDYLKKLKSRGKTLLIPYLFWNITILLVYYIAQNISVLDMWFNHKVEYNIQYVLASLWRMSTTTQPIVPQFWFVRDLMITVILTPALYFYVRMAKIYGILLLGVLWLFNCWFDFVETRGFSSVVVFFFTTGAWFGCNKRNLINDMNRVKSWTFILYPLLVIADFLTQKYTGNQFIHKIGIIVGIAFWFNFVANFLQIGKIKVHRFLVASSFFVFAIHEPCMQTPIRKILYAVLNPQSDFLITILYFLIVPIVAFIALGLCYILRRFMPQFTGMITGGRSIKFATCIMRDS